MRDYGLSVLCQFQLQGASHLETKAAQPLLDS